MSNYPKIDYSKVLKSGKVLAIVGSVSSAKSNNMFNMIEYLLEREKKVSCFVLHEEYKQILGDRVTYFTTMEELEQLENSYIFVDEMGELLDFTNRKASHIKSIMRTFAQIEHNTNVLILCGVPDYFKKFIGKYIHDYIIHNSNLNEFINQSPTKNFVTGIKGNFVGSTRINTGVGNCYFQGRLYSVPYNEKFDKKKGQYHKLYKGL